MPVTMYHGTDARYRDAIMRDGLIPGKGKGGDAWALKFARNYRLETLEEAMKRTPSVFLTPDIDEARRFASVATEVNGDDTGIVFQVHIPDSAIPHMREDEYDTYGYRIERKIPARWISVAEVIPHPRVVRLDSEGFD